MSSISRKPESLLMSSRISQSKFKPCSHRTSELTFVDSSRTHLIFDASLMLVLTLKLTFGLNGTIDLNQCNP